MDARSAAVSGVDAVIVLFSAGGCCRAAAVRGVAGGMIKSSLAGVLSEKIRRAVLRVAWMSAAGASPTTTESNLIKAHSTRSSGFITAEGILSRTESEGIV